MTEIPYPLPVLLGSASLAASIGLVIELARTTSFGAEVGLLTMLTLTIANTYFSAEFAIRLDEVNKYIRARNSRKTPGK